MFSYNTHRKPIAAGSLYSEAPIVLEKEITSLFNNAKEKKVNNTKALIVPHSSYVFSGSVAASGINQLDKTKLYKRIFLLSSSHFHPFEGVSTNIIDNYDSPLGSFEVDTALTKQLIKEHPFINYLKKVHINEHSNEVVLPLLKQHLDNDFKIVPLILGNKPSSYPIQLAEALCPFLNDENLFIITADFSHHLNYTDAIKVDNETTNAICSGNSNSFLETLQKHKSDKLTKDTTTTCGAKAIETLLRITENKAVTYTSIEYKNSGDTEFGQKQKVVGYCSIAVH